MLIAAGDWIQMIGGIVFSIGALMIYALFYQTRLIPRWLSAWGFIGGVLYFVANFVSMFSPQHIAPSIESGIGVLLIPLAIQEMVFAVWLIVKGFNRQNIAALSAKTE
jgi:drug/metabolite transporter (DMT)-like permease